MSVSVLEHRTSRQDEEEVVELFAKLKLSEPAKPLFNFQTRKPARPDVLQTTTTRLRRNQVNEVAQGSLWACLIPVLVSAIVFIFLQGLLSQLFPYLPHY